jgi:hypothetical protein
MPRRASSTAIAAGRWVGDDAQGVGLGAGELARQPVQEPVEPGSAALVDDVDQVRRGLHGQPELLGGAGHGREDVTDRGRDQRTRRRLRHLPVLTAHLGRMTDSCEVLGQARGQHDRVTRRELAGEVLERLCL